MASNEKSSGSSSSGDAKASSASPASEESAQKSGSGSGSSDNFHYEVPGLSSFSQASGSDRDQSLSNQSPPEGYSVSDPSGASSQPSGSSSDPQTTSSSGTKHTSSSSNSKSGSSSVTWHQTVPEQKDGSDGKKSSLSSSTTSTDDDSKGPRDLQAIHGRSSLRRFKEGSKVFVGFLEDADGLQPNDDMLPPMTWEEKCEIIEELSTALEKRLERLKNEKGGVVDGLQIYLEAADDKISMARKDRVELYRNVIQFAELLNPSKKPFTEDMMRFLNGRIIEKRTLKEKLERANRRLQKMVTTAAEQLEAKVDVKDLLHDSDIMELNDLNKEVGKQLGARSHLLEKARNTSRRAVQLVKVLREDLQNKVDAKKLIQRNLSDRSPLIDRFTETIEREKMESERLNMELLGCVKGEDMRPTALEYMKIRQRTKDLRRELYNWFAKVEIAELTHSELNKHLEH